MGRLARAAFCDAARHAGRLAIFILAVCGSTIALSQQSTPTAGIAVRAATPEEVRQSIATEDRLIGAARPIEGLPQRLAYFIETTLPSFTVLGRSDATKDNWIAVQQNGQPSPFICFGDLDGNGLQDAAVILRDNASGDLVLMAFHQVQITINPGDFTKLGYESYRIGRAGVDDPRVPLSDVAVLCNRPGSFQSADGSITLGLKNASIQFGYSLYYFDGAYQSLAIGD